ncbi:MAG: DUF2799 domain-containing protein [Pseudomonadota bacterium]
MKHLAMLAAAGCLAALAGCTTIPVEERAAACAQTDWTKFGVNDGTLGVPTADRSEKFEDCAEVGQPADLAAYQAGRSEGLKTYCTLENGYQVGLEGRRYENVCPPALAADFLQGFERGKKERPSYARSPSIGIGVGTGGTRVGVGIGIGLFNGFYFHDSFFHRKRFKHRRFKRHHRKHRRHKRY